MKSRRGFSVPEMLAVVAIIVIIISLLLPAYRTARDMARMAPCLSNQHQLAMGWRAYATDNLGVMMGSHTWRTNFDWVMDPAAPVLPTNETADNIRNGMMFPYVNTLDVYRCPNEPRTAYLRSYSGNNFLAGSNDWHIEVVWKTAGIPQPANTMVYVEEPDPRGYNWGSWVIYPGTHASKDSWIDWSANFHKPGGCTHSFADGHAALRIFEDPRTAQIAGFGATTPNNPDLIYFQSVYNPGK